jgi:hypothetical protein
MVEIAGVDIPNEILVAIGSALSDIIATYFGAVTKFKKDLQFEYDKDL